MKRLADQAAYITSLEPDFRALSDEELRGKTAELRERFLAAYGARGAGMDPQRTRWYLASTLLRLACIYALRPPWHTLAPRLCRESRRALGHEG